MNAPDTPRPERDFEFPPLPPRWPTHAKAALVHVQALARIVFGLVLGEAAEEFGGIAECAGCARLDSELALRGEHTSLLHQRFGTIPARKRPQYSRQARLRALLLMAARGWNRKQAAAALLVEPATISRWLAEAEGDSPLLEIAEPINKYPDMVTRVVHDLKVRFPHFGKQRIAEMLARLGLQLAVSTVGRKLKQAPPPAPDEASPKTAPARGGEGPEDGADAGAPAEAKNTLEAKYPGHIWSVDISVVPTFLGFWVPWFPHSVAPSWPFCWHVLGVLDFFSRKVVATAVFRKNPTGDEVALALDHAVARAGGQAPRYMVSDKGSQFWSHETECASETFREWCVRHGVRRRFGAIGKTGSIARVERFWRTLKSEWTRRILVPFRLDAMHVDIA